MSRFDGLPLHSFGLRLLSRWCRVAWFLLSLSGGLLLTRGLFLPSLFEIWWDLKALNFSPRLPF